MYVRISNKMVNSDDVRDIKTFYSLVEINYKNGNYESILCHSDKEASDAVNAVINAKNGVGRYYTSAPSSPAVVTTGRSTSERIDSIDRQMAALNEKKKQLEQQKAAEDGAEALAALLVGGVCAIADAISSRKKRK